MLRTDLVEHSELQGFFRHPTESYIYVTKYGHVYDNTRRRFCNVLKEDSENYVSFVIDGRDYLVHRLICETFLTPPDVAPGTRLLPNHKNGNKRDNRLDNLEWVTFSGNVLHAYQTGLRSDNTPILIKDLRTGSIQRFYSLQACARHFNVNGSRIHYYLNPKNRGKVWFDHYVLIHEGGEWPEIDLSKSEEPKSGLPQDVVVFDTEYDKYIVFAGHGEASRYTNVAVDTIGMGLRRTKGRDDFWYQNGRWKFCHLDRMPVKPEYERREKTIKMYPGFAKQRTPVPIRVENLMTGEIKQYPSAESLANELGVSKNTFQKHLGYNDGVWKKTLKVVYERPGVAPSSNTGMISS